MWLLCGSGCLSLGDNGHTPEANLGGTANDAGVGDAPWQSGGSGGSSAGSGGDTSTKYSCGLDQYGQGCYCKSDPNGTLTDPQCGGDGGCATDSVTLSSGPMVDKSGLPGKVVISADSSDHVRTKSICFSVDTLQAVCDTEPTYAYTWLSPTDGPHTVRADVLNCAGNVVASSSTSFTLP